MFALSSTARNIGKVFHFRIQRSLIGAYFVSDKISFATLGELIRYYQNNSRSLGVPLDEPCAQQVCVCVCVYTNQLSLTHTHLHFVDTIHNPVILWMVNVLGHIPLKSNHIC